MSFSRLKTRRFMDPSAFTLYKISTSPTIAVSLIPPTGTPTFPFMLIRSFKCVETAKPKRPSVSIPGRRSPET